MPTLFDKSKAPRLNPVLEIRNYCLRLLTESGKSYSAAEKTLEEVAFNLQRDNVRFNLVK